MKAEVKMTKLSKIIALLLVAFSIQAAPQSFYLKSGEKVTGELLTEKSADSTLVVKTEFGEMTLAKSELMTESAQITLANGDRLIGQILKEDREELILLTKGGQLTIPQKKIMRIDFTVQGNSAPSLEKFTLAREKQVDVFYDATGYTLEERTLYVSGLSWGFGISPRLQIMSKWVDYFWGNFNIRPKYQLFHSGSWEREQALAVGFAFNTRYQNDFYEWQEGKVPIDVGYYDDQSHKTIKTGTMDAYYGAYIPFGSALDLYDNSGIVDTSGYYGYYGWVDFDAPEFQEYYEVFAAYTFSRARATHSGRMHHTFGGRIGKLGNYDDYVYRAYYAGAVDIRKNLILNYEMFYDPFYVEWWNRSASGFFGGGMDLEREPVQKPDVSPWHFDIGFIYAPTDWLRFGIHFQPYIFAIYMKF